LQVASVFEDIFKMASMIFYIKTHHVVVSVENKCTYTFIHVSKK